jgi:filamentous hemagglutinin family protein
VLDGSIGTACNPALPASCIIPDLGGSTFAVLETAGHGERAGENVFFSFERLDVPTGGAAFFLYGLDALGYVATAPSATERLIARITGGPSLIEGTVDTTFYTDFRGRSPDLFLLNPDGLFIGPGGSFNVAGSLFLSTADTLFFDDPLAGEVAFGTRRTLDPELSVGAPSEFGFLADVPAPVAFYSPSATGGLAVPLDLTIVAGDVEMLGVTLTSGGGSIRVAAVSGDPAQVRVPLDPSEPISGRVPDAQRGVLLGTSALDGSGRVPAAVQAILDGYARNPDGSLAPAPATLVAEASGSGTHGIVIRGGRFVAAGDPDGPAPGQEPGGLQVLAIANLPPEEALAIDVGVSDEIRVESGAAVVANAANGPSGAIALAAARVIVEGGSVISRQSGASPAAAIGVEASDSVEVSAFGQILSRAEAGASAAGGDVTVTVSDPQGTILVEGNSQIAALTESGNASANGGSLLLDAARVEARDGGQLRTTSSGAADAGALDVAAETVSLAGVSALGTQSGIFALAEGAGDGGAVDVAAQSVSVENGARIATSTSGAGNAGSIHIDAQESILVRGGEQGESRIASESSATAAVGIGDGGDIRLETASLQLLAGGEVSATTVTEGDAGSVAIAASEVTIDGANAPPGDASTGIFARSADAGRSGAVDLEVSGRLALREGGAISVASDDNGVPGDIEITGGGVVTLSRGTITAAVLNASSDPSARADVRIGRSLDAGGASVSAPMRRVDLADGSVISAETRGTADGGEIAIEAAEGVTLASGSRISALSAGDPGDAGDGGNILVDAGRRFEARGGSEVTTEVRNEVGNEAGGGSIDLLASEWIVLEDSVIRTQVNAGAGNAGSITAPAAIPGSVTPEQPAGEPAGPPPRFIVLNRSLISANAEEGDGGNVRLAAGDFLSSAESAITASSTRGLAGTIVVQGADSQLAARVVPLRTDFFDAAESMLPPCSARSAQSGSFVIQSRRVEPPPDAPLGAELAFAAAPPLDPTANPQCTL